MNEDKALVDQWSSIFFGTRDQFVEDNFSRSWVGVGNGFGVIQVHCIQAHLLLCVLVPNRQTSTGPGPEVGGPCTRLPKFLLRPQSKKWQVSK